MKRFVQLLLGFTMISISNAAPNPSDVLRKADAIRNPQLDYKVGVKVSSYKPGRPTSESTFQVFVKGKEKSVVKTLSPSVDRGRILLMLGNNFWAFLPNVSKPLRIALQERLVGEVANGDLARANLVGDYTVTNMESKKIQKTAYFVLDMKGNTDQVTYGRVVLWVEAASSRPFKAEFYASSGRLLKVCDYENYRSIGGDMRPTRLVMRDAINKEQYSVLEYSEMNVAPLPEKYFSKDYMKTMAAQ